MFKKYYTTQMSDSARELQMRFTKIRSGISVRARVMSAFTAAVIVAAGICASVVMAAMNNTPAVIYEVYNGDTQIALMHNPIIYDGEYYLPIREVLNGFDITDITYDEGTVTVTFPDSTQPWKITVGEAYVWIDNDTQILMRGAPIMPDGERVYAPIHFFEMVMQYANQMTDFHLNVMRQTEPQYYYTSDEEVFIGTAAEQDAYKPTDENGEPKLVKRILTDSEGKTVAVIPVEHQIEENIDAKFFRTGVANELNSYQELFNGITYFTAADGTKVLITNLYLIDDTDSTYAAYIAAADFITLPMNEQRAEMHSTITNTYGE